MLSETRSFRITALLLATAAPLWSQVPTPDGSLAGFRIGARLATPGFDPAALADVFGVHRLAFIQYLRSKPSHAAFTRNAAFRATFGSVLQSVENGRVDEQAGASAAAGGAASAAEKAGITGLITAALETGAMTQTLDQNLLTLRGNAEGLFRFLTGQEVLPACVTPEDTSCDPSPINNLELTASFNVSKSSTTEAVSGQNPFNGAELAALLTSTKRQFSNASARYVVVNSRDLRSKTYRDAWVKWFQANEGALGLAGADLLKATDDIFNIVANTQAKDPAGNPLTVTTPGPGGANIVLNVMVYDKWQKDTKAALTAAPRTEAGIAGVLKQRLDLLEVEIRNPIPDLDDRLELAANAYVRYFNLTRKGFELANMPMLTAQFTYSEPTLQPKLIEGKFAFAWSPKGAGTVNPGTLTLNGGISMYTKPQPKDAKGGTGRWRHAQVAFQFDRPMGGSGAPASLSLGAYFQYQISPGLINIPAGTSAPGGVPLPGNAAQLLAPKGTIAVAHAGITLQIPNSGIKLPISISWSNRTEFLTGNEIRGHIGFNFDTHSPLLGGR